MKKQVKVQQTSIGKQAKIAALDLVTMKAQVPIIRAGYSVRVTQKIKEGDKERLQIFEGLVITTHLNGGINSTIRVRKISDGIGVEKVFPLHAPSIADIQVIKVAEVRRAKLYYMRERSGKSARLVETQTTAAQRGLMMKQYSIPTTVSDEVAEEVVAA